MVLNYDCVRDTMLYLEDNISVIAGKTSSVYPVSYRSICSSGKLPYTNDDIYYTIVQLNDAGYIKTGNELHSAGRIVNFDILDITYSGHQFLTDIKNPEINKLVKKAVTGIGQISMQTLIKVASSVITPIVANAME